MQIAGSLVGMMMAGIIGIIGEEIGLMLEVVGAHYNYFK